MSMTKKLLLGAAAVALAGLSLVSTMAANTAKDCPKMCPRTGTCPPTCPAGCRGC